MTCFERESKELDFGKILDAWHDREERDQRRRMDRLMEKYGPTESDVQDRLSHAGDDEQQPRAQNVAPRKLPIEDELDLHGLREDEARRRLIAFLDVSVSRGLGKVLIIHGKGLHSKHAPVLRSLVHKTLESYSHAGMRGPADTKNGGAGAVWVVLRQPRTKHR